MTFPSHWDTEPLESDGKQLESPTLIAAVSYL